jgi:hypothetical protein
MNAFSAYILMLATMTYSLELLCCVIVGLMTGYWIFGGDSYTHAGSPCCAFLDDDENNTNPDDRDDGTVMTTEFISTYIDTTDDGTTDNNNNNNNRQHSNEGGLGRSEAREGDAGHEIIDDISDSNFGTTTTTTSKIGGDSCCGSHNKV